MNLRERVKKLEAVTSAVSLIDACGLTEAELHRIIENTVKELERPGDPLTPETAAALQDLKRYLEEERDRHANAG